MEYSKAQFEMVIQKFISSTMPKDAANQILKYAKNQGRGVS